MSNIVIDDTNSTLTYSGQWTLLAGGSSRQWDSTVHSTFQTGATVSFQFQGTYVLLIFDISYLLFVIQGQSARSTELYQWAMVVQS